MVNFDKLGSRAGQEGYKRIDKPWGELHPKQKKVIKTLIQHPEKSQKEIAEITGNVNPAHVHNVVYSLPPEMYNKYKEDIIQESDVEITPENFDVDEHDLITVTAPMRVNVELKIPRSDLNKATMAALGLEATTAGTSR